MSAPHTCSSENCETVTYFKYCARCDFARAEAKYQRCEKYMRNAPRHRWHDRQKIAAKVAESEK